MQADSHQIFIATIPDPIRRKRVTKKVLGAI